MRLTKLVNECRGHSIEAVKRNTEWIKDRNEEHHVREREVNEEKEQLG